MVGEYRVTLRRENDLIKVDMKGHSEDDIHAQRAE